MPLGSPFSIKCDSITLIVSFILSGFMFSSTTIPVPELEKRGSIPTDFKVYNETGILYIEYSLPSSISHACFNVVLMRLLYCLETFTSTRYFIMRLDISWTGNFKNDNKSIP